MKPIRNFLLFALVLAQVAAFSQAQFGPNSDSYITGQGSQTAINRNVILATAGAGSTDCSPVGGTAYRSWSILIVPASGTVTAGVITFEGSNDNFVSTALPVLMYDLSSQTAVPITTITLVASTPRYLGGKIPFRYLRARISTGITGTTTGVQAFTSLKPVEFVPMVYTIAQATGASLNTAVSSVNPGVSAGNLGKAEDAIAGSADTGVAIWGVQQNAAATSAATGDYHLIAVNAYGGVLTAPFATTAKTYSASNAVTVAASATDIALINGNATNTVIVTRVIVTGNATTAGSYQVSLIKRSAANSGGTSTSFTPLPHEAADGAAVSSAVLYYTANPTPGATVNTVRTEFIAFGSTTVGGGGVEWDFGKYGKGIVLSGTAQGLAVNLGGATITGGVVSVTFEFIELP